MLDEYRGLAAIQSHIKAFWQQRHGVEEPLSPDPKNAFLRKFDAKIADMIKAVDQTRRELIEIRKYYPALPPNTNTPSLAELRMNIYESLRRLRFELHEMKPLYFADKKFCDLLALLEQDLDGEAKQLSGSHPDQRNTSRDGYVDSVGGAYVVAIQQNLIPFYGSEVRRKDNTLIESTGVCLGIIDSEANGHGGNTHEIFRRQTTMQSVTRSDIITHTNMISLEELFRKPHDFKRGAYYTAISIYGENVGHIMELRECNGIGEFELNDPNFGSIRFPNKEATIQFLKYHLLYYKILNDHSKCYLSKIPISDPLSTPKEDVALCTQSTRAPDEEAVLDGFDMAYTMLAKYLDGMDLTRTEMVTFFQLTLNFIKKSNNSRYIFYAEMMEKLIAEYHYETAKTLCIVIIELATNSLSPHCKSLSLNFINGIANIQNAHTRGEDYVETLYQHALGTHYTPAFGKLDKHKKRLMTRILLTVEYDPAKLLAIFNKHSSQPNLLVFDIKLSPETIAKMLNILDACDNKLLYVIYDELYPLPENNYNALRTYSVITDMGKEEEVLSNRGYYNRNFFITLRDTIDMDPEQTPEKIFYRTVLKIDTQKMHDILHGTSAYREADFLILLDKVGKNPYATEYTSNECRFIKELLIAMNTRDSQKIKTFISENMDAYIYHFISAQKLCFIGRHDEIIQQVCDHLALNLSDKEQCRCMFMLYQQPRYRMMAIDAVASAKKHFTFENRAFLLPILIDSIMIKKMDTEDFENLLINIACCDDSNYPHSDKFDEKSKQAVFFSIFDDTVLNQRFIHQLSPDKIIVLFKFLTKADQHKHSMAECFQYPQLRDNQGTESRWEQIIFDLRNAFDEHPEARTDPDDAALLKSDKLVREVEHMRMTRN